MNYPSLRFGPLEVSILHANFAWPFGLSRTHPSETLIDLPGNIALLNHRGVNAAHTSMIAAEAANPA